MWGNNHKDRRGTLWRKQMDDSCGTLWRQLETVLWWEKTGTLTESLHYGVEAQETSGSCDEAFTS